MAFLLVARMLTLYLQPSHQQSVSPTSAVHSFSELLPLSLTIFQQQGFLLQKTLPYNPSRKTCTCAHPLLKSLHSALSILSLVSSKSLTLAYLPFLPLHHSF